MAIDVVPPAAAAGRVARALAMDSNLILFEGRTSALNDELVGVVLAVMRELADRVVFMDAGVVVEEGPPLEVINNPQHERTRSFLSRIRAEGEEHAAALAERAKAEQV